MMALAVRGITIEQMGQLVEMSEHFYTTDIMEVYQDPDFLDNVVFASKQGDDYNTIGWFQVCVELLLPVIVDEASNKQLGLISGFVDKEDVKISFVMELFKSKMHPVDMLYSAFQIIKQDEKR